MNGRDMVWLFVTLLVIGGVVGVGCYEGCGYVVRHVEVEWQ
jgi:hypothetical protein